LVADLEIMKGVACSQSQFFDNKQVPKYTYYLAPKTSAEANETSSRNNFPPF